MKTKYPGIDYGLGRTNIDHETNIRYGIISPGSLDSWLYVRLESVYIARCPETGDELSDDFCDGDTCPQCDEIHTSDDMYGDEPDMQIYEGDGIEAELTDLGLMIFKSPVYTLAQFCSPCVPGAGDLDSPCFFGVPTYALPADWFENDKAPYRVRSVEARAKKLAKRK